MTSEIAWQWSRFAEMTPHALYAALRARSEVFVVEQHCAFLDLDGADQEAWHLLGWVERGGTKVLAAYLRLLPPGCKFIEPRTQHRRVSAGRRRARTDARGRAQIGRDPSAARYSNWSAALSGEVLRRFRLSAGVRTIPRRRHRTHRNAAPRHKLICEAAGWRNMAAVPAFAL
jgi:hypothetical protein